MTSDLKTIASFLYTDDAEVARTALAQEGIESFLEGGSTVAMIGGLSNAVGGVKLQVARKDVASALSVLAQASESSHDESAETKTCPHCGADVPFQFEVCWSCESPLSEDIAINRPADGEVEEETAKGDGMAWRAVLASIIGIFLFPPLLHFYSGWILLQIAFQEPPLSRKGTSHFWFAACIDVVACLIVGWFSVEAMGQ